MCLVNIHTVGMVLNVFLISLGSVFLCGINPIERVDLYLCLNTVYAVRVKLHIPKNGTFGIAHHSICPVKIHSFQHLKMAHYRVAMLHRGIVIGVEIVLQHSGFRTEHGIIVCLLLVLHF